MKYTRKMFSSGAVCGVVTDGQYRNNVTLLGSMWIPRLTPHSAYQSMNPLDRIQTL